MLRVLVVDDSPVARDLLKEILNNDPGIEVVGVAHDGAEAVELVKQLRPDVVTMDVQMPRMDGFAATEEIMILQPTPIVVVSGSMSDPDVEKSMNSLRAGALTVIGKPDSPSSAQFDQTAAVLLDTVKTMSQVKVVRRHRRNASTPDNGSTQKVDISGNRSPTKIIAIAASTGGPQALHQIISRLPADFPIPVLLVQHISKGFAEGFAAWLDHAVPAHVKTAVDGEPLLPGTVYVAPEDVHLGVTVGGKSQLIDCPALGGFRPAGTVLFESVAKAYGSSALAVILTGMGRDGVDGLHSIRQVNGRIIAQDEESCVVFGMPKAAIEANLADEVLSPDGIAGQLNQLFNPEVIS